MPGGPCWRCGALPKCPRCGSTDRRPSRPWECAECHRRHGRARTARLREAADFEVTPAMRRYLEAFDAWLREPLPGHEAARLEALEALRNDEAPHSGGASGDAAERST